MNFIYSGYDTQSLYSFFFFLDYSLRSQGPGSPVILLAGASVMVQWSRVWGVRIQRLEVGVGKLLVRWGVTSNIPNSILYLISAQELPIFLPLGTNLHESRHYVIHTVFCSPLQLQCLPQWQTALSKYTVNELPKLPILNYTGKCLKVLPGI